MQEDIEVEVECPICKHKWMHQDTIEVDTSEIEREPPDTDWRD